MKVKVVETSIEDPIASFGIADQVITLGKKQRVGLVTRIEVADREVVYFLDGEGDDPEGDFLYRRAALQLIERATIELANKAAEMCGGYSFGDDGDLVSFGIGDTVSIIEHADSDNTSLIVDILFQSGEILYTTCGDSDGQQDENLYRHDELRLVCRASVDDVQEALARKNDPDGLFRQDDPDAGDEDPDQLKAYRVSFDYWRSGNDGRPAQHEHTQIMYGYTRDDVMDQVNLFTLKTDGGSLHPANVTFDGPVALRLPDF